jgi:hypothetical protein
MWNDDCLSFDYHQACPFVDVYHAPARPMPGAQN